MTPRSAASHTLLTHYSFEGTCVLKDRLTGQTVNRFVAVNAAAELCYKYRPERKTDILHRRPWFDPGLVHVRFMAHKVAMSQVFSPDTSVLSCQYKSNIVLHSSLSACQHYQKDKRAKPANFHKTKLFRTSPLHVKSFSCFSHPVRVLLI